MHEADDELRDIKREIIESRGLVIKTNNLTSALSADIKSIAKRQQGYERKLGWNSAAAYVVFVVVVFAALKLVVDARVDAIEATSKYLREENSRMKTDLDQAQAREVERRAAGLEAAKFYDLIREGKRADVVKQWDSMKSKPMTQAEAQFFSDAVGKARAEQAMALYLQGMENARLQRWQEAASAFEDSIHCDPSTPMAQQAQFQLAAAYRKLKRAKDAIVVLVPLTETSADRELQCEALVQLAECQTDLEAFADAKSTWRTLLRKFPDSHLAPQAKLALQALTPAH